MRLVNESLLCISCVKHKTIFSCQIILNFNNFKSLPKLDLVIKWVVCCPLDSSLHREIFLREYSRAVLLFTYLYFGAFCKCVLLSQQGHVTLQLPY